MPEIKFTADYTVDHPGGATYKAGDIEEMSGASARHFVRRNVAVYWAGKTKEDPKVPGEDRRVKPYYELQPDVTTGAKHVGGGTYVLPDGTRIKGKDAAAAAMAKIKIDKTQPEPDRAAVAKRTLSDV